MRTQPFSIDEKLIEADGTLDEGAAIVWKSELMARFAKSPEFLSAGSDGYYADAMIEFALQFAGVTPARMSMHHLDEILFQLFPRKLSCDPNQSAQIMNDIRAFWHFAEREFGLSNAADLAARLDQAATRRLERELANPANYGLAKSFVTQGQGARFDMTTQAGLDQFMLAYTSGVPSQQRPWGVRTNRRKKGKRTG